MVVYSVHGVWGNYQSYHLALFLPNRIRTVRISLVEAEDCHQPSTPSEDAYLSRKTPFVLFGTREAVLARLLADPMETHANERHLLAAA